MIQIRRLRSLRELEHAHLTGCVVQHLIPPSGLPTSLHGLLLSIHTEVKGSVCTYKLAELALHGEASCVIRGDHLTLLRSYLSTPAQSARVG